MKRLSILFSLTVTTWAGAAGATMFKPSFCALSLLAGSRVEHSGPLKSLTELEVALAKLGRSSAANGYASVNYVNDLRHPRPRLLGLRTAAVRARLARLKTDTLDATEGMMFAGWEYRGTDRVRQALDLYRTHGPDLNARVQTELERRFPRLRFANFLHLGYSTIMLGLPPLLMSFPQSASTGYWLLAPAWLVAGLNEAVIPWSRRDRHSVPIDWQFDLIERSLEGRTDAPVSIISGSFDAETDLHKVLMDVDADRLTEDELRLLVNAAESYMIQYGDLDWAEREQAEATRHMSVRQEYRFLQEVAAHSARLYPEGRRRHIYYDSIFYVENGQPVWLVYYRSFKDNPYAFRPPRPSRRPTETKAVWDPGWAPGSARVSP